MTSTGIWSRFDLVEFKAQDFLNLNGHLADLEGYLLQLVRLGHKGGLNQSEEAMIRGRLDQISELCRQLQLFLSIDQIGRLKELIRGYGKLSTISHGLAELRNRIIDEMKKSVFLSITTADYNLYRDTTPFGSEVADFVPRNIGEDIEESSKCLALDRFTASVFHLMRVMEYFVQRLGTYLGVALAHEKNWQNILDETNKAIRAMPYVTTEDKGRQARFGQIAAHLFNVKIAWRNSVMHPKASYTQEEAMDIFSYVDTFSRTLVLVMAAA